MTEEEIEAEAIALNDYVFFSTHYGATKEYFENKTIRLVDQMRILEKSVVILTDAAVI